MPKLTVALPTFNRAQMLKKTIESILSQSYQDYSIIILDNNSSDDTQHVVNSFTDERISYIRNSQNIGWLNNTNRAFSLNESNYLLIFHDDDIMKDGFLKREVSILESNQDVVAVACNIELMDDDENFIAEKALKISNDILFNQYEYFESFYKDDIYLPCPTVMFRSEFIKTSALRFEKESGPCADAYFWNKISTYPLKMYLIADPLVKYRVHTKTEQQILPNFGKNYRNQFLLHKNSYELAKEKNLHHIIPYIIKRRNFFNKLLYRDFILNKIDRSELLIEINRNRFSNDKFLFYDISKWMYITNKKIIYFLYKMISFLKRN